MGLAALAAVVAIALAGMGGLARGAVAAPTAPKVIVDLKNDRFSKRTIRVKKGTKVRYRFLDAGFLVRRSILFLIPALGMISGLQ